MFGPKRKIQILVVDDEPTVSSTIRRILEKRGYSVTTFENPLAALDWIKTDPCDLILTDLKMPQMDGIQFLTQIKRLQPAVPVILITAYSTIDTAVMAIKYGGFDYLQKPFDVQKIYEVVQRALDSTQK